MSSNRSSSMGVSPALGPRSAETASIPHYTDAEIEIFVTLSLVNARKGSNTRGVW
jgi:hypothetical protein